MTHKFKVFILTNTLIFIAMIVLAPPLANLSHNIFSNHYTSPIFGLLLILIFGVDWHVQVYKLRIFRERYPISVTNDPLRAIFLFFIWCCRMMPEFLLLNIGISALLLHFVSKNSLIYIIPFSFAGILAFIKASHLVFVETHINRKPNPSYKPLPLHLLNIACSLVIISAVSGAIINGPTLNFYEWSSINWAILAKKPGEIIGFFVLIGLIYLPLRWIDVLEGDLSAKNTQERLWSMAHFVLEGAIVLSPMLRLYLRAWI